MNFITGKLYDDNNRILFSAEEGTGLFCFMHDIIPKNDDGLILGIKCNDKLAFGQTHDHRQIAVYTGRDDYLLIPRGKGFATSAYILTNHPCPRDEFASFDSITFHGGSLNKIFAPKRIKFSSAGDEYLAMIKDDSIDYTVNLEGIGETSITIQSRIQRTWKNSEGCSIDNSEVQLTLTFPQPQRLQCAINHYLAIKSMISFMTYRNNVGFDKVSLLLSKRDTQDGKHEYFPAYAELKLFTATKLTKKNHFECITVEKLGNSFPALLELFFITPEKKQKKGCSKFEPILGFIPEDDTEAMVMSNARIKEICSAIEYEMPHAKELMMKKNEYISKLKEIVLQTIDDFRRTDSGLSNDVYDSIKTSIGYWSTPLRERMCALCDKYSDELNAVIQSRYPYDDYRLDHDKIKRFVQYRNAITHQGAQLIDIDVCRTAFVLSAVVYCCILERIGVSKDLILAICHNGIIL